MDDFIIDCTTRVIGRRDDGAYLVTNHPSSTINNIDYCAAIIDAKGNVLSSLLGNEGIIKFDIWYEENYYLIPRNIILNSLLGFAIGDAFGIPVESLDREDIRKLNLNDMVTGMYSVPKGTWSNDTSMILSTMDSIINTNGDINYNDIINNFIKIINYGKYTSLGYAFNIDSTIIKILNNYKIKNNIFSFEYKELMDNKNSSLMRMLPLSLYCIIKDLNEEKTKEIINKSSSLTNAHDISKMGCYIYTEYLRTIIKTKNKTLAFENILNKDYSCYSNEAQKEYNRLLNESFIEIEDIKINSSNYIVDTLESVLYCVLNTKSYEESILTSVNLGGDTNTISAITGSITGILYDGNIPKRWLNVLQRRDDLINIANQFKIILENNNEGEKNE